MPNYVIPPPPVVAVPVDGGGDFPVRRVFCVGRNYAEHVREMGGDPTRSEPFFFMKPADALVLGGADTAYPPATSDLHHEIELVVAIGKPGADIAVGAATDHVFGYAVGIDLTRRDLQADAKKHGRPWDMAKGFDQSAPIGPIAPAGPNGPNGGIGHPSAGAIMLEVDGAVRQSADLAMMIWTVPETIAYLSGLVRLMPGDLIFTGTPEGVAAVTRGARLTGRIDGVGSVSTRIV